MPGQPNFSCKQLALDSNGSNVVEIPLDDFQNGKYSITLDWEIDNQLFIHHQEFEINDNRTFIPATS